MLWEQAVRGLWDGWWGPASGEETRPRDAVELTEALRQARGRLEECRAEGDTLLARVVEQERRAGQLAARVQSYLYVADPARAWEGALTLEQVRRHLAADRADLEECRRRQRHLEARVAALDARQRRLTQLPDRD